MEHRIRPWSELPSELLEQIADVLSIIELLCFRSVCKDWRLATATASAICTLKEEPWFLLYDENSKCYLYDILSKKSYTMVIPEFDGATCIASKDGWLLLHHNRSLYFFCPFSRVKIDLPQFQHLELTNLVGVFTAAPTSPDCVVGVMNYGDDKKFEIHTIKRGSTEWVNHAYYHPITNKITCATFCHSEGTFYIIHSGNYVHKLVVKDVPKDDIWSRWRIVPTLKGFPNMPFIRGSKYRYLEEILGLEEGDTVSTCGTLEARSGCDCYIENEDFTAEEKKKSCNEDIMAEEEKEICYKKGVWVHPRFFQLQTNQSW